MNQLNTDIDAYQVASLDYFQTNNFNKIKEEWHTLMKLVYCI